MLLLPCAPAAFGQGAPAGPLAPEPGVQPETPPQGAQKPSIRVRVNEIIAPVTVLDRSGEMVFDLAEKDFRVFDDGVEQKIEHFDLGGESLSVVLAVETSSRIEPHASGGAADGHRVLTNGNGPDGGSGGDRIR